VLKHKLIITFSISLLLVELVHNNLTLVAANFWLVDAAGRLVPHLFSSPHNSSKVRSA
jgi:hypothetical protein